MAEMNARLRAFLDEVREWFWAHDYAGEDHPNDLLIAVERVLRAHPDLQPIDLLRDILEADPLEFVFLDVKDHP